MCPCIPASAPDKQAGPNNNTIARTHDPCSHARTHASIQYTTPTWSSASVPALTPTCFGLLNRPVKDGLCRAKEASSACCCWDLLLTWRQFHFTFTRRRTPMARAAAATIPTTQQQPTVDTLQLIMHTLCLNSTVATLLQLTLPCCTIKVTTATHLMMPISKLGTLGNRRKEEETCR